MVIPKLASCWSCVNKVFDRETGIVDSPIWGLHFTLNGFGFEFQVGRGGGSNTSLVTFLPLSALVCGLRGENTFVWCLAIGVMLVGLAAS